MTREEMQRTWEELLASCGGMLDISVTKRGVMQHLDKMSIEVLLAMRPVCHFFDHVPPGLCCLVCGEEVAEPEVCVTMTPQIPDPRMGFQAGLCATCAEGSLATVRQRVMQAFEDSTNIKARLLHHPAGHA